MTYSLNTLNADRTSDTPAGVSRFTQEIVLLLLDGKPNKVIEDKLFIAESTVKNHISSIHRKLEVKNRAQLVAFFKNYKRD